jgi:hypothetical protein
MHVLAFHHTTAICTFSVLELPEGHHRRRAAVHILDRVVSRTSSRFGRQGHNLPLKTVFSKVCTGCTNSI